MLEKLGVLARIDGNALARYCVLYSRWLKVEEFLARNGSTHVVMEPTKTKGEKPKIRYVAQFPQVSIAARLAGLLARLEAEFGMTPSSRTAINTGGESKDARTQLADVLRRNSS